MTRQSTNYKRIILVTRKEKKISFKFGRIVIAVTCSSKTCSETNRKSNRSFPPKRNARPSNFGQRVVWLAMITIWLILAAPLIINMIERVHAWYAGTLFAVYLGINLTTDQIIVIADKIFDVVIAIGNKE